MKKRKRKSPGRCVVQGASQEPGKGFNPQNLPVPGEPEEENGEEEGKEVPIGRPVSEREFEEMKEKAKKAKPVKKKAQTDPSGPGDRE